MTFTQENCSAILFFQHIHDQFAALAEFESIYDDAANAHWTIRKIDENLYIDFTSVQESIYDGNTCLGVGMRITYSSDWDNVNHLPAGSTITQFFELGGLSYTGGDQRGAYDTLAERITYMGNNFTWTYWLDKYGLQACFTNPYPEPKTSAATFLCIEFIPVAFREFDDGLPSVYGTSVFSFGLDTGRLNNINKAVRGLTIASKTNQLYEFGREAYKSLGNNKIYFDFPYYFNDSATSVWNTPSARTRRWFLVEKVDAGLIAGDIISYIDVEAAITRKFLVCEITAIDSALSSFVAIPYENAFLYEISP